MEGKRLTLKVDKFSHLRKGDKYGSKGERVVLVSNNSGVPIVENKYGNRFSVRPEEVNEEI